MLFRLAPAQMGGGIGKINTVGDGLLGMETAPGREKSNVSDISLTTFPSRISLEGRSALFRGIVSFTTGKAVQDHKADSWEKPPVYTLKYPRWGNLYVCNQSGFALLEELAQTHCAGHDDFSRAAV